MGRTRTHAERVRHQSCVSRSMGGGEGSMGGGGSSIVQRATASWISSALL